MATSTKMFFITQLGERLKENERVAQRSEAEARDAARDGATEQEKREDGRVTLEFGSLAKAQAVRVRKAQEELGALARFVNSGLKAFRREGPIGLGAMIDVSIESEAGAYEERTLLLLPVGAGNELTGPGGDGYLSVITPASPAGKALLGRRAGETVELMARDEARTWTVLEVA